MYKLLMVFLIFLFDEGSISYEQEGPCQVSETHNTEYWVE